MASNGRVRRWHEARESGLRDLVDRAEEWRNVADDLADALYRLIEEPSDTNQRRAAAAITAYESARRQ